MYPASVIARAFVQRGIDEGNPVTQMKLQKLIYFAQGIHLAMHHTPLVKDVIQAWKFGPVIPEIYQEYKLYGSLPITDFKYARSFSFFDENPNYILDEDAKYTINETWNALKNLNAIELSNWTHADGSPWSNHFKQGIADISIPTDEMETYFKRYLL